MFELGMRLAFDKPTIIIKDDKTDYSFDTAPIEHLTYPKDLRYSKILTFQSDLGGKLLGTWQRFKDDPNASTFLKAFGSFHVATLETKEVSTDQLVLDEIRELRSELSAIHPQQATPYLPQSSFDGLTNILRPKGPENSGLSPELRERMQKFQKEQQRERQKKAAEALSILEREGKLGPGKTSEPES